MLLNMVDNGIAHSHGTIVAVGNSRVPFEIAGQLSSASDNIAEERPVPGKDGQTERPSVGQLSYSFPFRFGRKVQSAKSADTKKKHQKRPGGLSKRIGFGIIATGASAQSDRHTRDRSSPNKKANYQKENDVLFWVIDDGKGIDKKIGVKIFERFFSGKKGRLGLGLAVVKEIAEAMNWKVSLLEPE